MRNWDKTQKGKEWHKRYIKEWFKTEIGKQYIESQKKYRKQYNKFWAKKKRQNDPRFRLDVNIASIISTSLKGKKAGKKWEGLVGYTIDDLMKHLEKQFDDKINWGNYGSYWSVDHIKPRSLFKYKTTEDPEFKKCWALENLQPLEKKINIKKSNYFLK